MDAVKDSENSVVQIGRSHWYKGFKLHKKTKDGKS